MLRPCHSTSSVCGLYRLPLQAEHGAPTATPVRIRTEPASTVLFDGRPVIGILNTWSELTPCNAHLHDLAQRVKHGIYEAGGFPVEVPVFSAAESSFRPTAMMFRNLAAMAVEEAMRGQPIDGAVLLSTRGGDYELHLGQDLSIGYLSHDAESIELYLQETLTFLPYTSEASVVLTH